MTNPAVDFRFLYRFRNLLDKHPIRVSISVKPGFPSAVKLALALNFAVKLEVGQPDRPLIEELSEVLNHYLHRSIVSQPVEYFHSIFLSFYHQEPSSLWFIQEEDPDQIRFVSDDGTESLSTRFGSVGQNAARLSLAQVIKHVPSGARIECDDCEFLDRCGGYFKWPDRSFSCDGVKELFRTIQQAAAELTNDLKQVPAAQG
jgi:hypothetical protein